MQELLAAPLTNDSRSIELRCAILKELVLSGHNAARATLYGYCVRSPDSADVFACDEIVELDGQAGLLFVARKLGELLEQDSKFRVDDSPLWTFDSTRSDGDAVATLLRAAPTDRWIQRYLDSLNSRDQQQSSAPKRVREIPEVLDIVQASTQSLYWLGYWARELEEHDLQPFLQLALTDNSDWVRENALRCVAGSKRISFQPTVLQLLSHKAAAVRDFAAKAVSRHTDPSIRASALEVLPGDPDTALTALLSTARAEDAEQIWSAITSNPLHSEPHDIVFPLVQILRATPSLSASSLALYVYLESPCTNCRGQAVKTLFRDGQVPEWLRAEGMEDSCEEVHNLCRGTP